MMNSLSPLFPSTIRRSMNGNFTDDKLITQGQVAEGEIRHILMKEKSCPLTILLRPAASLHIIYPTGINAGI